MLELFARALPGLLVIAPAEWLPDLGPWVEVRAREWSVESAPLEAVLASESGADAPERIKRFLYRAWRERGATHALLVGDADSFPVRFMVLDRVTPAAQDVAFYPCDHYYADLAEPDGSFDDWNAAREGEHAHYFGEVQGEKHKQGPIDLDGVSYAPELALGRWPASTRAELRALVAKTLAWQPARELRSSWWHVDGWVDARERVRAAAASCAALGPTELALFGAEHAPSAPALLAALAQGGALAVHIGHGSNETWEGLLGAREREQLERTPASLFVSIGCSTAHWCVEPPYQAYLDEQGLLHAGTNNGERFDAPPPAPASLQPGRLDESGLGEQLVLAPAGGAVAYIGCCTGAQPCALTLLDGLAAAAGAGAPTIGEAWRRALAHYERAERLRELAPNEDWYPPSIFFQGMKFELLGDPSLPLCARER